MNIEIEQKLEEACPDIEERELLKDNLMKCYNEADYNGYFNILSYLNGRIWKYKITARSAYDNVEIGPFKTMEEVTQYCYKKGISTSLIKEIPRQGDSYGKEIVRHRKNKIHCREY